MTLFQIYIIHDIFYRRIDSSWYSESGVRHAAAAADTNLTRLLHGMTHAQRAAMTDGMIRTHKDVDAPGMFEAIRKMDGS